VNRDLCSTAAAHRRPSRIAGRDTEATRTAGRGRPVLVSPQHPARRPPRTIPMAVLRQTTSKLDTRSVGSVASGEIRVAVPRVWRLSHPGPSLAFCAQGLGYGIIADSHDRGGYGNRGDVHIPAESRTAWRGMSFGQSRHGNQNPTDSLRARGAGSSARPQNGRRTVAEREAPHPRAATPTAKRCPAPFPLAQ